MKRLSVIAILLFCLIGVVGTISALGAEKEVKVSVQTALLLPEGSKVVLEGRILRRAPFPYSSPHYFIFGDSSGEMVLDIEKSAWPKVTVHPTTLVEVRGVMVIGFRGRRVKIESVVPLEGGKSPGDVVQKQPVFNGQKI